MKKCLLLILALVANLTALAQEDYTPQSEGEIVKHTYFSLAYSEEHEQPLWVYYYLTPEMTQATSSRKNNFREDDAVSTGSATLRDYARSGYDRGHLCPAGDMAFSSTAMSESFFMSNMSPQVPSFNRGGWKRLESYVREMGSTSNGIHVATGAVFVDNIGTIGNSEVTIPGHYYKVIYNESDKEMTAYIMPNRKITEKDLSVFRCSVDSVETVTGVDFFWQLDDEIENELESRE